MKMWQREPELRSALDDAIPAILASQKPNGQFGTEPWISTDQNVLLALAAAWSLPDSAHYQSRDVLRSIERGGLAIRDAQDERGMVLFRKKDHSTWGPIYMPWVYSRWVRTFALVREAMSDEARAEWESALLLGYEGIAQNELQRIHNIPAHHAMGLYCAGQVFEREAWCDQARDFLHQVTDAQAADGWWAEHEGPVVAYNLVYVDSLGVYYALSGDEQVLDAIERASRYHAACVYPDGSLLETIDGRNSYHTGVRLGNAGFSHTPAGRGFLAQQHALFLQDGGRFDADYAALMLLYGTDGDIVETSAAQQQHTHRMSDDALIKRHAPWYYCLSAFTAPLTPNRFGQDRQNFFSLYHDDVGLICGGGNTKLQPLWSSFSVGNTALMYHVPGDEDPDFSARPGLRHVPERAALHDDVLHLHYGTAECRTAVHVVNEHEVEIELSTSGGNGEPVEAHLTLVAHAGRALHGDMGICEALGEEALDWPDPLWIAHAGWHLDLPPGARLYWPVLPHNPYRKDGAATVEEARIVVVLPFAENCTQHTLTLRVTDHESPRSP